MRVCELAAEMGTTNVDILKRAGALEIEAYSSLSKLSQKEVAQIKDTLKGRRVDEIRRSIADREALFARKREAARKSAADGAEKSRAALQKHLELARSAADAVIAAKAAKEKAKEAGARSKTAGSVCWKTVRARSCARPMCMRMRTAHTSTSTSNPPRRAGALRPGTM